MENYWWGVLAVTLGGWWVWGAISERRQAAKWRKRNGVPDPQ